MLRATRAVFLAALFASGSARAFVWPSTVEAVARDLGDPDAKVRRHAAHRLFDLAPRVVQRVALPALVDPDPEVRVAALEALVQARVRGLGARVTSWLSDGDARVRRAAAVALVKEPTPEATSQLGRVLSDPEGSVRIAAARALGASSDRAAMVPLLGRLDDPDPDVREAVVRSLSRLGDPGAVVPLVGKIQDTRPTVRRSVAAALGALGDARASGPLLLLLRDPDETVRTAALVALGRIRAEDAVATIASLLDDERKPEVREAAYGALSAIPSDAGIGALVEALGRDDPRERSPIRAALARAGERAVSRLTSCLSGQPSFDLADGCALTLGEMKAPNVVDIVDNALRRGVVRPQAALRALGASGDGRGLVTVLEYLSSDDPWVRRVALEAATALLSPREPDGRAVEPILRAVDAAHARRSERLALGSLLGLTGSARAVPLLTAMAADESDPSLRLVAIQALGLIPLGTADAALLAGLRDPDARIRYAAALSLRAAGAGSTAEALLGRFESAAAEDRASLLLALPGPLSRATAPGPFAHAARLLERARGGDADALVDALGAASGARGSAPLVALAGGADVETRAKIAEVLATHPEALATLRHLAADPDARVRANAAWSLGAAGSPADTARLVSLAAERDTAVAANAAAALGLLGARGAEVTPALCQLAQEERAYVRANALAGLAVSRGACPPSFVQEILATDPTDLVREAAARLLWEASDRDAGTRSALERCAADEPSGAVARACAAPPTVPSPERHSTVSVYVVPLGATEPVPRAPFALARADGLFRLGVSDRRGIVTEPLSPEGALRLEVPDAVAE